MIVSAWRVRRWCRRPDPHLLLLTAGFVAEEEEEVEAEEPVFADGERVEALRRAKARFGDAWNNLSGATPVCIHLLPSISIAAEVGRARVRPKALGARRRHEGAGCR